VSHPPVVIAGVHEKIKEGRLVDEANLKFALEAVAALVADIRTEQRSFVPAGVAYAA